MRLRHEIRKTSSVDTPFVLCAAISRKSRVRSRKWREKQFRASTQAKPNLKPNAALRIPEDIGKLTEDNHCGDHSL